ncbi:hypothetical protein O6H91_22G065800 [Diphasiastrum complanatum]|uniref:Uncharacterized protein n=1 Tax=Diphasiastrum complanatum TaxID=34168 RepID=A0ACC2AGE3_DIPCM|nr:hypothetical protein O6H91_22G065800 [Diphasiastrum complanatum]
MLETLRLDTNKLFGSLQLDFGKLQYLKYFSVANNNLTGTIPSSFGSSNSSLVLVDLSWNQLTGVIPPQVQSVHLRSLRVLTLAHNHLNGSIPSWIGSLKSLQVLVLSHNYLQGPIPQNLADLDGFKVTSNSSASKSGAFTLNQRVNLTLRGESQEYAYVLVTTTYFDLSSNALTGEIPQDLGKLIALRYLTLSNNRLEGEIPPNFGSLWELETLDQSQNNLTGTIPSGLAHISSLSNFNVSFNNLQGLIPADGFGQFSTFDASSFLPGNPGLCGDVIKRACISPPQQLQPLNLSQKDDPWTHFTNAISIPGFWVGMTIGFCSVIFVFISWAPARSFVFHPKKRLAGGVHSHYGAYKTRS